MSLEHTEAAPRAPERVVVIGAGGFVGRTLLRGLDAAGITALRLTSADIDLTADGAADALAKELRDGDSVVFLSAITPDKGRGTEPFMRNMRMAAAVAGAIETTPPAHLVYFSSDAVYPMTVNPVREDSPAEPTDLYGAMHLSRELMIKGAAPCPCAVVRPTLIYGGEDTHNSYGPNRLRRMARDKGEITLFGEGEETRDHILVDDVVGLTITLLQRRSSGLLNLATGESISYWDLAEKVAGQFSPAKTVAGTPRQNPITHRRFDITALREAFPDFQFTPLDDGIAKAHAEMMAGAA